LVSQEFGRQNGLNSATSLFIYRVWKLLGILSIAPFLVSCDLSVSSMLETSRKSFVKIRKAVTYTTCRHKGRKNKKKEVCEKEPTVEIQWTGSASVISTNSIGSFILTAEHVCEGGHDLESLEDFLEERFLNKKQHFKIDRVLKSVGYNGQVATLDIIAGDPALDVCILFAEGYFAKPLKRYYGDLLVGKVYYNIAAPFGIFEPGFVPLLEGRFIGNPEPHRSAFSIPAAGGSSGSPIVDERGRLVGLIHSVTRGFNHLSYGPKLNRMNILIDESIKDYHDKWYQNMLELSRPKPKRVD